MANQLLDEKKPYGVVYGDPLARYEQDGLIYDHQKRLVGTPVTYAAQKAIVEQLTPDNIDNAKALLKQVLRNGPVSKASVYKAAEGCNVSWNDAKEAASRLNLIKFNYGKTEMWKLPEEELNGLED